MARLAPDAKPLGSPRVRTLYNDQPLKTAKSGDAKERMAPPRRPDDLIVPDPRERITHNARGGIIDVYTA